MTRRLSAAIFACVLTAGTCVSLSQASQTEALLQHPDHFEFAATIDAPFKMSGNQLPIRMHFNYPGAYDQIAALWQVELRAPDGSLVKRWRGQSDLSQQLARETLSFAISEKLQRRLAPGYYSLQLKAVPSTSAIKDDTELAKRFKIASNTFADEVAEQTVTLQIGYVKPATMAPFKALPVNGERQSKTKAPSESLQSVAANGLPYTIYYGNMHSQTNHSDGGGAIGSCTSSQAPQAGAFGPTDAFNMMRTQAGGDFLLASEHNHMYDGSTGTSSSATPAQANNLFSSGLNEAAAYNSANPQFLAVYGLEWGVISNGGHLNIVNPDILPNWELNGLGELLGGVNTPKSDYAALYATMKQRGWIGQFNHPATSGQFIINSTPLAFDANGKDVMVLTEILNTSAFSTNTTETETSKSTFFTAFNTLLERGFHVAPATNQDNHCANWGLSSRNRTGVLLPDTAPYRLDTFVDALKARRVFATEDKTAQLVLTANGAVMGSEISNNGALTLVANYASSSGQTVQRVQFLQGVPGRNGTVTQLYEGSNTHTFTPVNGSHFYYALVTETDGDRLWSAPIWINQGAAPADTEAPVISASSAGSSGMITFNANASDNVGVTNVDFLVDGLLVGSDSTAPYSIGFDSTTVSNGSHNLSAKAYDAAGNIGTSSTVPFSINNPLPDTTPPTVSASVTGSSGLITLSATASDNVGVTSVEFLIDNVSVGTDTSDPYSMSYDSTSLSNGSHNLVVKAFDAAGNTGTSATVPFTVSNASTSMNEQESNGTIATANVVPSNVTRINGSMGSTSDKDYFAIVMGAGAQLNLTLTGPTSSSYNYNLYLYNAGGTLLKQSTASRSNESMSYTNTGGAATFYAQVRTSKGKGQPYTLDLALVNATENISNGGFESGSAPWVASTGTVFSSGGSIPARTGGSKAWLNGLGSANTQTLQQTISLPGSASSISLNFWLRVNSAETTTTQAYDTLKVQVRNSSGALLATLATYSNLDKGSSYVQRTFDLTAYKGQQIQVYFEGMEGSIVQTGFLIDDVSVTSL